MTVRLRFDWVDAGPSPDCAMRQTMAALSIEAGGLAITAVRDRRSQVYRSHVVVPLLGVAEWLVNNWWYLWHEVADTGEQRPGFEQRHNLAFAGDGFVLPKLTIVPTSERVHLRWTRWQPRHVPIEFVEESETYIDRAEVEAEFRTVIDAVLQRLCSLPNGSSIADDLSTAWEAVNSLDPDEIEFSRAVALLGIDPYDVENPLADAITSFWDRVEPSIREEALASADASSLARVVEWLDEALDTLEATGRENGWAEIRETLSVAQAAEPWRQGYELANTIRRRLGIGEGRFDFDSQGPLAVRHRETVSPCSRIQGLVAANTPDCVTIRRSETGKRFMLARALGDYISRPEPGFGILGSLFTDRQARSRAFAAQLLAPAESLRARLENGLMQDETIDELGLEFGVSSQVILHQIENHKLATPFQGRVGWNAPWA